MLTFLFCGEDTNAKEAKITELKNKYLTSPEALKFDYELLHAHKLEPKTLKEALISLPAVIPKRIIVIRDCQRLNPYNKDLIFEFVSQKADYAILILDTDEGDLNDSFMKKLKPLVKFVDFSKVVKLNVFDLTRVISMQKAADALKILGNLLSQGEHPLQIMGGLVWFWGKSRDKMASTHFEHWLLALQEADLNIKRSRLEPEQALEVLVVKLCAKEAY